jgi:hypothetical protein
VIKSYSKFNQLNFGNFSQGAGTPVIERVIAFSQLARVKLCCDFSIIFFPHVVAAFSDQQFKDWLDLVMPWTLRLGAASLALEILFAIIRSFQNNCGVLKKNLYLVQTLIFGAIAAAMFAISLVCVMLFL